MQSQRARAVARGALQWITAARKASRSLSNRGRHRAEVAAEMARVSIHRAAPRRVQAALGCLALAARNRGRVGPLDWRVSRAADAAQAIGNAAPIARDRRPPLAI
eukprot:8513980-Pyramimonas_sp.AAC.1